MNLKEWKKAHKQSVPVMAKDVGVTENYLYRVISGKIKPSRFLAKEIERYTDGDVTVEELRAECKYKGLDSMRLCEAIIACAGIDKLNQILRFYHTGE